MMQTGLPIRWLASTSVLLTSSLVHAGSPTTITVGSSTQASDAPASPGVTIPSTGLDITLPPKKDERGCPLVAVTPEACRTMANDAKPCFLEQMGESGSICAEALQADAVQQGTSHGKTIVQSPQGMEGDLREAYAVPPIASFAPGKPDQASYTSMRNDQLNRMAAGKATYGDLYQLNGWNNNGNRVNSCREYVYEKYYEYSRFQEEIAKRATTYRDYFNIAFEQATQPWAIGSRHLDPNDPLRYRSKDGETPRGGSIFRTRKHFVPIDIAVVELDIPGHLWNRADVLRWRELQEKAKRNRDPARDTLVENMRWHQRKSDELMRAARLRPASLLIHDSSASGHSGQIQLVKNGYTDEELNALYPRIRNLQSMLQYFHKVSVEKVCNAAGVQESAWTVEDPRWRIDPVDYQVRPPEFLISSLLEAIQPQVDQMVATQLVATQGVRSNDSASSMARECAERAAAWLTSFIVYLPYLVQEMNYLDEIGCLESGVTACDWSPALFAMDLSTMASEEQEIDFKLCLQRVPNASNFTRGPEDEGLYDSLCPRNGMVRCGPVTARAFPTPRVDFDHEQCGDPTDDQCAVALTVSTSAACRACRANPGDGVQCEECARAKKDLLLDIDRRCNANPYDEDGKRLDFGGSSTQFETYYDALDQWTPSVRYCQYMKAVAAIGRRAPQLISDGKVRQPGFRTSHSETLGSSYFGVDYGWTASTMVSDLSAARDTCGIHLNANTSFNVKARVLTMQDELMRASIDTTNGSIYAYIKDAPVYAPANQNGEAYDLVMAPDKASKPIGSKGFDTWISILGVPLHVTGGVTGTVGFKGHALVDRDWNCRKSTKASTGDPGNVSRSLDLQLRPFASLSGYATAAVDAVIAAAGIKGSLLILEASLPITVQESLKTSPYTGPGADSTGMETTFATLADASVELQAMSGAFDAFVQIGVCPFCDDAQMRLFSWEGPKWRKILSQDKYNVAAEDLLTVFNPTYQQ